MKFFSNLFAEANALIVEHLGDLGPLIVAGGLGLLLILVALPSILFKKKDPLDRIREMHINQDQGETPHSLRRGGKDERLNRFAQYLEPQDQAQFSAAQLQLVRAGYRSKGAVQMFHFAQFALGIGGLLLGIMENYGQALFGTQWRDVVAFVLLVLVLLIKPTGILGESLGKARA